MPLIPGEANKGSPNSSKADHKADTWLSVGEQHREFFRVGNEGVSTPQVSLIARVVQEPLPGETGEYKRDKLSNTELENLLKLAVQLYDKETQRSEFWQRVWLPALIAATSTGVAIINMIVSFA